MSGWDVAAAVCLVLGALLGLSAGLGLVRFPTTLDRMHAGTKPQVLGVLLVLLAMWLHRPTWGNAGPLLLAGISQVIGVSVAGHVVARAAYLRGSPEDASSPESPGSPDSPGSPGSFDGEG
ncbi:monovalent cation/H(+) antiporter subunit G [Nonomuraea pusilla]|uniref:Multicomponent Na+:H+ antiporter subunit G n=1 Tax=Nonomuraea pusilla TaxID=46177 RepID=A0A1H7TNL5_9ACTN|nr:monovalent cation/H(+) antiporter subunit G [Nonomuraea pusilla]SEL86145.1 multicomponent Na+:H+ antiporter subunit G [Nonomuraea pusilla]